MITLCFKNEYRYTVLQLCIIIYKCIAFTSLVWNPIWIITLHTHTHTHTHTQNKNMYEISSIIYDSN